MKKKSLIVAGSIIVVLLGLAGCSNDSANTNSSTETTKLAANTDKQVEAPKTDNSTTQKPTNEKKESNYGGIDPNVVEHKEMNGSNTTQIGNYATTTYDAATTTDADIIKFYNDKIKDSKNSYFTLIDGSNSIEFCDSNGDTMIKGSIENTDRSIVEPLYYGEIDGNKIKWVKPSKDTI